MTDVLHVITGLGTGGAETMLVQLAGALRARGLSQQVVSLSARDALAADLLATGVGLTILNGKSWLSAPGVIGALMRRVNELQPRILQGWMYHGNIAATVAHYLCAGRARRRLFWNLRASNMDEDRYGRIIRLSGLLSGLPDTVIANSEAGARFHREHGIHPKRFVVIDNGIDTGKFRPDPAARQRLRHELGISDEATVVIHVARVDPMKDHASFLTAMAQVPSLTGLMVGQDTEKLAMPPNVRALGMRRDTAALYAAADIVASSSAFGEGFSNVIAEGMSAGLVPVATDVGDARRIVAETGCIVAPKDSQALAAVLRDFASLPAAERCRRGIIARERILANCPLEHAAEAFMQLYVET